MLWGDYFLYFDEVGCEHVDDEDEDEDKGFDWELFNHLVFYKYWIIWVDDDAELKMIICIWIVKLWSKQYIDK